MCLSAAAQPFNAVTSLPFLSRRVGNTTNLAGVVYRWVSSDLATNTTINTNWLDQIQSWAMTNGATANQPTNSSSGVWIDSSHWLTNVPLNIATSNMAFGLIFNVVNPSVGIHPDIISDGNEGAIGTSSIQLGFLWPNYELCLNPGFPGSTLTTANFDSLANQLVDVAYVQSVTNNAGDAICYTNNVLSAQVVISTLFYFGNGQPGPRLFGRNEFRTTGPSMRVLEFWVWTNTPTANQLSDWHHYATNTYHYSP